MNYKRLIISLALPQLAGGLGAIFTSPAIPTWYAGLVKPSFNPPSCIFGPVWLMLYFLMGVSVYLIWSSYASTDAKALADKKASEGQDEKKKAGDALWIFWFHLIFNFLWTPIFFGLHDLLLALIIIIIIVALIVIMIYKFWSINKLSSILLIPYLLWVSFATLLNYFILILN